MLIIYIFLIVLFLTLCVVNEKQKIDKHKFNKKPYYYRLLKNALNILIPITLILLVYIFYSFFGTLSSD